MPRMTRSEAQARRAAMLADYCAGMTRKELALKYGMGYDNVCKQLRRAGVIPRRRIKHW